MLARFVAATVFVALSNSGAGAATPFADHCEGNICFQGKVRMGCMKEEARRLLREIASRFGKIEVASACDGRHAIRSAHYVGKAFDFRPYQATRAEVVAFLKAAPHVGGVGTYSNGLIHADVSDRKMAWHGSGRGRVVWPVGAGTIVKAPDDPPVAQASAFSLLDLFKSPTSQPADDSSRLASASPPPGAAPDPVAGVGLRTALPPLPPRRPVALLALVGEAASAPGEADAAMQIVAAGEAGYAQARGARSTTARVAFAATETGRAGQSFATVAPDTRGEFRSVAAANRGFAPDESIFSAKALAPPSQTGFSLARAPLP